VLPPRSLSRQVKRTEQSAQPSKGRRSTINSLTAPEPVYDDRLPAPNAELKVPEPPSRSPSPPTSIIPQGRGNKYTPEDREFFLKFISWRLKCDSTLNRNDLCAQLAEKVVVFCIFMNSLLRLSCHLGTSSHCSVMGILLVKSPRPSR
jgi:hypothetical protein